MRRGFWILLAFCGLCLGLLEPASAERVDGRRAALVIGNSDYQTLTPLPNAVKDAHRIGEVLTKANFEVTLGSDLDKAELEQTLRDFLRSLNDGDVALFYYSGHAVQVAGENFILPIDASLSSSYDLEVQSYNISNLLDYMRQASALQILILDACRDNPFKSDHFFKGKDKIAVKGNKGLASLTPRQGSLIVYSTAPDQVAYDGAGDLSPFTESLSDHILTPNEEVRQVLTSIRADVIARTNGRQVPWDVSSLTSQFYFVTKQDLLVLGESLTEVRVSPQARRIKLEIPKPVSTGGMVLQAQFDQAPKSGALMLDDKKIDPGTPIDMDRLEDVTYLLETDNPSVELIPYTVSSAEGHKASGAVAIVFDPELPPQQHEPVAVDETAGPQKRQAPVQLAVAADVGTGFLTISDAMPQTERMPDGWYRIGARSPSAQIALGSDMLAEGDLVKSEDVAQLAIRPSLKIVETDAKVVLEPVGRSANEEPAPVVIQVNASVNPCDELAGEPLDIQGVVEGVYPNDMKIEEALSACEAAVRSFPDVARFKHQLGRVLFAKGDFAAAIENLRGALDAGHVRSGYLLGRLYQLGGPLGRDPAQAIPLFEAGARRGDPYAQHALGRALVEGVGTQPDIERGMELLTRAAEAGHTYSMNALGTEYLNGNRVEKDPARALSFFQESAERTDVYGLLNLGVLYRDGVGVARDLDRARELFQRAHDGGHPRAGTVIGLLMRANGGDDPKQLLPWFRESAARGDAWGAFHAANLLRDNPDLEKEEGEMIRLLGLSASHQTPDVSERAAKALQGIDQRLVAMEIQKTLVRMGQDVGAVDGALGPRSRQAASAVLGDAAPQEVRDLLVELLRREWLDLRPRLDMLG